MATIPPVPADAAAWDQARTAFAKSILIDTPLASLAQDLDVPPWPVTSPDETPAAYIYLPYNQAVAALAARGLPPAQLGRLITLLNDTNAFDQPFGDMMAEPAAPAAGASPDTPDAESPLIKNLVKLGLPEDFPLELSALSPGTVQLCQIEKITTLGGFVAFASRLSQTVIVGGDFRELLNALAQKDEAGLARLLPLRPGRPGLHLVEAVALAARDLNPAGRAALLADPASAPAPLRARVARCVAYFAAEHAALASGSAAGEPLAPRLPALAEPGLAPLVVALLAPHLPAPPAPPAPAAKPSFWRRLFGGG